MAQTHHIPGYGDVCHPWLTQWVIYERPRDFPDLYVARPWQIHSGDGRASGFILPMQDVVAHPKLEVIRNWLRDEMAMECLPRWPNDDPVVVEVWI